MVPLLSAVVLALALGGTAVVLATSGGQDEAAVAAPASSRPAAAASKPAAAASKPAAAPSTPAAAPKATSCADGGACAIGDTGPGGGTVFYDAGSVESWGRYLEAAPAGWAGTPEDPLLVWCESRVEVTTRAAIGAGAANTSTILKACPGSEAMSAVAEYSGGGKLDWFIPSLFELDALSNQSAVLAGLGFGTWSSSLSTPIRAYGLFVGTGNLSDYQTLSPLGVRPVRAF